ncbi:hypothetical protein V490_01399 [Pseudogymnoascus sp. VKM F-3557]|nr:hypothetical protein V490_01399 [Pseudogymnoascus sp. VKM F-3557]
MVQPSPNLLLRPAASLASSFNIFAHPKVPLTPNESRQLLNAVTASFRRQLAEEHGIPLPNRVHTGPASAGPTTSSSSPKKAPARPNLNPTDRHLHDVLNNPLLSFQPPPKRTGQRDPMDVFDEACARGFMDIARARACLHAKRLSLGKSPEEQRAGMKTSGAGSKVLQWLLSTGAESDSSWLQQVGPGLGKIKMDVFVEFLVLEGKQEALWELFERYAGPQIHDRQALLYQLNRSLTNNISTNAGLESVVRANEILARAETPFQTAIQILYPAIAVMVNHIKYDAPENIQPDLYDRFLGIVHTVPYRSVVSNQDFFQPELYLRHPTHPDTKPALRYLESLEVAPERLKLAIHGHAKSVASLALDTTKQLIADKQFSDANWVLKFVQMAFPELHSGEPQTNTSPSHIERAMGLLGIVRQKYAVHKVSLPKTEQAGVVKTQAEQATVKTTPIRKEDDMASLRALDRLDLAGS